MAGAGAGAAAGGGGAAASAAGEGAALAAAAEEPNHRRTNERLPGHPGLLFEESTRFLKTGSRSNQTVIENIVRLSQTGRTKVFPATLVWWFGLVQYQSRQSS